MQRQEASYPADSLLIPFLQSVDRDESQRLLEHLIVDQAGPLIRQIVRRKLRGSFDRDDYTILRQDSEDVASQTVIRLIRSLGELKADPQGKAILDFENYVAVVTYHTCNEHLRQKHPRRWRLRNRLRYLLTRREGFALWEDRGEWLCSLAGPDAGSDGSSRGRSLRELRLSPDASQQVGLSSDAAQRLDPALVVEAILKWAGRPVELDDLVDLVAGWWGISDQVLASESEDAVGDRLDLLPSSTEDVSVLLERRVHLERLWKEIQELPVRQRSALLLNLRDEQGQGVIELLPLTGVASIRQIARALDMADEQFAALWNGLPLDDAAIAGLLGITRQQVINLRKSARERLARRMKKRLGVG
jgi:RNA polymerase sigma factor (sigma-70 family)